MLSLTGGLNRNITDLELATKLGVDHSNLLKYLEKNEIPELRKTKLSQMVCSNCGSDIEVSSDIDFAYCRRCGCQYEQIPRFKIGINEDNAITFLKKKASKIDRRAIILREESSKLLLGIEAYKLAIYVSTSNIGLEELYNLKGWSLNDHPDFYLLLAVGWSFTLKSENSKELVGLLLIEKLLSPSSVKEELELVKRGIDKAKSEKALETKLNWVTQDSNLADIEKFWRTMLSNIKAYAMQAGDEHASVQGNDFQRYVIDLLRVTVFEARLIGGKNNPDGSIFIEAANSLDKSEIVPLEVKTVKKKFVPIQKHAEQIRKYVRAFKSTFVTSRYQIKRIVILGNDFNRNNSKDKEVIARLESDLDVKIVLFPIDSLICLVKLYFEYQISFVDNQKISQFLENPYIEVVHVNQLMEQLKQESEQRDKDLYDKIESDLRQSGY